MAQVQFNIDELKEVVVTTSSGNLRPKGVDFPNGTKWRKPVVLHVPPAPVASCYYQRGDEQSKGSEHSSADSGRTDTPRWHDTITTQLNMPSDWGHNATTYFESVDQDWSTGSSGTATCTFSATPDIKPALWCISAISYSTSSNRVTATLEIYNPGCRSVSWDICDSTGKSVGSTIVSGWTTSADSDNRTIHEKARKTITISCAPEKLFPNNTYGPGAVGTSFYIKFIDKYTLCNSNSTIYGWNYATEKIVQVPQATESRSSAISFVYYAGGIKVTNGPRVSALPAEIRTIAANTTQVIPYLSITNPFTVAITYDIHTAGYVGYPSQAQEIFWGTINAGTTTTFQIKQYSVDGSQIYTYYRDATAFPKFNMYYRTSGGNLPSTGNPQETLVALPREIYPPVISRYDSDIVSGGNNQIILDIYNPNFFAATFTGSIDVSDSKVTTSWDTSSTCTLAAHSSTKVTINIPKDVPSVTIECGGTLEARLPEEASTGGASRKTIYKQTISSFTTRPKVEIYSTHSGANFTVTNPCSHSIWCRVLISGEYHSGYFIDPETGREEEIWSSYTRKHRFTLAPGASRQVFLAVPGDSGQYKTDCEVSAYNKLSTVPDLEFT